MNRAQADIDAVMGPRAVRLLEKNEPELCEGIRAAVAAGATPEEVRAAVRQMVGRKDTAEMAFYYARVLAGDLAAE